MLGKAAGKQSWVSRSLQMRDRAGNETSHLPLVACIGDLLRLVSHVFRHSRVMRHPFDVRCRTPHAYSVARYYV